jgi:hypothetical protein
MNTILRIIGTVALLATFVNVQSAARVTSPISSAPGIVNDDWYRVLACKINPSLCKRQ